MIMHTQYRLEGSGLPGNDDYGTMSAWFIFAALGFYPIPSTETYVLGSPIVASARIYRRMENGSLLPFSLRVQQGQKKRSQYKV
jgi:putative alpha-1,2-mannosidase